MPLKIFLKPEADAELAEAYTWYEEQSLGLGKAFLVCVEACLQKIQANPKLFPIVHREVRRALLQRFPYSVFYVKEKAIIYVVAIFHERRNPNHWKGRT